VGNLLFLSGTTGEGGDTGVQTRNIFEKIKKNLEDTGSCMENVVAATIYLTDINDRPKYFNPIWSEYFPENPPTRTCIEVGLAPPSKVEITVIATIPEKKF
jgi:2-iminobutanoate/2-iminopropanoate deaminase